MSFACVIGFVSKFKFQANILEAAAWPGNLGELKTVDSTQELERILFLFLHSRTQGNSIRATWDREMEPIISAYTLGGKIGVPDKVAAVTTPNTVTDVVMRTLATKTVIPTATALLTLSLF